MVPAMVIFESIHLKVPHSYPGYEVSSTFYFLLINIKFVTYSSNYISIPPRRFVRMVSLTPISDRVLDTEGSQHPGSVPDSEH